MLSRVNLYTSFTYIQLHTKNACWLYQTHFHGGNRSIQAFCVDFPGRATPASLTFTHCTRSRRGAGTLAGFGLGSVETGAAVRCFASYREVTLPWPGKRRRRALRFEACLIPGSSCAFFVEPDLFIHMILNNKKHGMAVAEFVGAVPMNETDRDEYQELIAWAGSGCRTTQSSKEIQE
jgi:hypothetical protein